MDWTHKTFLFVKGWFPNNSPFSNCSCSHDKVCKIQRYPCCQANTLIFLKEESFKRLSHMRMRVNWFRVQSQSPLVDPGVNDWSLQHYKSTWRGVDPMGVGSWEQGLSWPGLTLRHWFSPQCIRCTGSRSYEGCCYWNLDIALLPWICGHCQCQQGWVINRTSPHWKSIDS